MADVEFLEPEPVRHTPRADPDADEWQVRPPSSSDRAVRGASSALWLATAVLGVVAAFRAVWVIDYPALSISVVTMDGWGRADSNTPGSGQHGPRFAVAITVLCAAALLAGALGLIRRTEVAARIAGTVAAAGLAGVVASAYLYADSTLDTYRAAIRQESLDPSFRASAASSVQLHVGWFIWLGLIAVICAIAALALPLAVRIRGARGGVAAPSRPLTDGPELHPDDETLVAGPS